MMNNESTFPIKKEWDYQEPTRKLTLAKVVRMVQNW